MLMKALVDISSKELVNAKEKAEIVRKFSKPVILSRMNVSEAISGCFGLVQFYVDEKPYVLEVENAAPIFLDREGYDPLFLNGVRAEKSLKIIVFNHSMANVKFLASLTVMRPDAEIKLAPAPCEECTEERPIYEIQHYRGVCKKCHDKKWG